MTVLGPWKGLWLSLGSGVRRDLRGRMPCYGDDWQEGFHQGLRILAPATYIFCASAIPALAFGEQMADETGGILSGVQVLTATALAGVVQSVVGGQPLLIVGVAEPIVLMYKYMYDFADGQEGLGPRYFLPWAAWTCVFAAAMILVLALLNSCSYIDRFTRLAGELFGMLIAVLFMQQAIKGVRQEFLPPPHQSIDVSPAASEYQWRLVNGLWGLFLALGFLLTSLLARTAHAWRFLNTPIRGFLADYGVPLLIVVWAGLSYAVSGTPEGVPRRLLIPNTWEVKDSWSVAGSMGEVGGKYIAASLIPAAIIALLFFFDHNVSSQLAQQKEFNLTKPSAYHWDFLLLGLMTALCGLIGLPPVNGVLPQSPMHSKALSSIKKDRKRPRDSARAAGRAPLENGTLELVDTPQGGAGQDTVGIQQPPAGPTAYPLVVEDSGASGKIGEAGGGLGSVHPLTGHPSGAAGLHVSPSQQALVPGRGKGLSGGADGDTGQGASEGGEREGEEVVPLRVSEQRLSNLLQSLCIAACLGATPALKLIPSAVLWGYFAFMAIESLPGNQFWERLLLLGTDPKRRHHALESSHAPYLETVPYRVIVAFTLLQLAYTGVVYGLTWAGIAGCLFPIPIMVLVPIRQHLLPRIFRREHLWELDALEAEQAPALSHEQALQEAAETGMAPPVESEPDLRDMLDRETSRFQVVHHLGRASLERRRKSALGMAAGAGASGEGAGSHTL